MSLKPGPIQPIPAATIQVARAAFPKGNLYMTLRDELGTIFQDEDFAAFSLGTVSQHCRPGAWPW
jgi:transposase